MHKKNMQTKQVDGEGWIKMIILAWFTSYLDYVPYSWLATMVAVDSPSLLAHQTLFWQRNQFSDAHRAPWCRGLTHKYLKENCR